MDNAHPIPPIATIACLFLWWRRFARSRGQAGRGHAAALPHRRSGKV